jgi:phage shock protein A
MDQRTGHSQRRVDERRAAVTGDLERVEERVQETIDGVKSTVESALEGFKQVQEKVDGAKATADEMLESVTGTVNDTVERMKPVADLLDHLQQKPWLLLGGAILMGYILGSLARENAPSH